MKPAPFAYYAPATLDEALRLLGEHGDDAKPLAGGQSLVPAMNFRLAQPRVLVDLNGVPGLDGIAVGAEGDLRIGAMTRQRAIERSAEVRERVPLLAETMPHVAHLQIRNRGTLGGSLAHADPSAELPAVMVALDASVRCRSPEGERWVPARDFFLGLFATALAPGELIVEIAIPKRPGRTGFAFEEMARRHGDYALAGVAAAVELDAAGGCRSARVVLFGVGEGPVVAGRTSSALAGARPTPELLTDAAAAVEQDIDPPGDIHASADYRRHLARVLVRRALERAVARATGGDAS